MKKTLRTVDQQFLITATVSKSPADDTDTLLDGDLRDLNIVTESKMGGKNDIPNKTDMNNAQEDEENGMNSELENQIEAVLDQKEVIHEGYFGRLVRNFVRTESKARSYSSTS